jgi:hypothetical protein
MKPGRLTLKTREGLTLLTVTSQEAGPRHVVLAVGASTAALESAVAVEGLGQHLLRVAEWMRAQEVATAEAIEAMGNLMDELKDLARKGGAR